jgi:hypothetical protein
MFNFIAHLIKYGINIKTWHNTSLNYIKFMLDEYNTMERF